MSMSIKIAILFLLISQSSFGQPIVLDTTFNNFNTSGYVITELDDNCCLEVQQDGKILIGGEIDLGLGSDFCVARYNSDGSIDNSFGLQGIAKYNFQNLTDGDYANDMVIQPDGKILLIGISLSVMNSNQLAMVRFTPDGMLDTTFGSGGTILSTFGGSSSWGKSILLQTDGKILVAGSVNISFIGHLLMARYNEDGTLDDTFGDAGVAIMNVSDSLGLPVGGFTEIGLQSDGKIVGAGGLSIGSYFEESDFALIRYNSNGLIDSTFGTNGLVTTDYFENEGPSEIRILADDKILLGGIVYESDDVRSIALVRYNSDGSVDSSFGNNGLFSFNPTNNNVPCNDVLIQPDGKYVIVGRRINDSSSGSDFLTIRVNNDGTLDESFNNSGFVFSNIANSNVEEGDSGAIQEDGKILIAGRWIDHSLPTSPFFLNRIIIIRYIPDLNVSTQDFSENQNILVYPNPISDHTTLKYELEEKSNVSIELFSNEGKLIKSFLSNVQRSEGLNEEILNFDSYIPSGNYFLFIKNNEKQIGIKITIQK